MRFYLVLFTLFFALTLCLPLAGIGATLPAAPAESKPAGNSLPVGDVAKPPQQESTPLKKANAEPPKETPEKETLAAIKTTNEFRILNTSTGKVQRVSRIDYVRGAVCAEMPPSFHTQALAAQALAANTYAIRCKLEQEKKPDKALKGADFSADPDNWRGYVTKAQAEERFGNKFDVYWGKICEGADLGSGYVAVYEDEPIVAAYHSLSAGKTEAASNVWQGNAPYLLPAESFGDTLAEGYETTAVFTPQEVKKRLQKENAAVDLTDNDYENWFETTEYSDSGYVLDILCGGQRFSGIDLRRIFELRSSNFDISYEKSGFTFSVRGYGHGVGLSQYGADYMARQGADFKEIIEHYYTGCELRTVKK